MHSFVNTEFEEMSPHVLGKRERPLFPRNVNYLRDMALFWPFVLYSVFGVASAFSPGRRQLAIKFAVVAIATLALAKEKLLLFVVGTGFIALQCATTLILHRWNWGVFVAGILTSCPFLLAGLYCRKRKLTYRLPSEFRLVDALWSIASLTGSLLLLYVLNLRK